MKTFIQIKDRTNKTHLINTRYIEEITPEAISIGWEIKIIWITPEEYTRIVDQLTHYGEIIK